MTTTQGIPDNDGDPFEWINAAVGFARQMVVLPGEPPTRPEFVIANATRAQACAAIASALIAAAVAS